MGTFLLTGLLALTGAAVDNISEADTIAFEEIVMASCSSIRDNDLRYFCSGSCSSIRSNDMRYFCSNSCSSIRSGDVRYFCSKSCSSIRSNDVRYFCGSGKKNPFFR